MAAEVYSWVAYDTQHLLHTFKAGHRIMVQNQRSRIPLVDRNPELIKKITNPIGIRAWQF
jgi:predicted acyl esterase